MRGECSAGVTPHTTRYPIKLASANVNAFPIRSGLVNLPSASTDAIPAVMTPVWRVVSWKGVSATTSGSFSASGLAAGGGGGAGRGAGGRISPLWVTMEPRTTSSERSTPNSFSRGVMERRSLVMLLEYRVEDWVGRREGKSV